MLPPEQLEQQQSVWGEMAAMIREMRVLRIAHSIRNETGRPIMAAQRVNDRHSGFFKPARPQWEEVYSACIISSWPQSRKPEGKSEHMNQMMFYKQHHEREIIYLNHS
jgi:hypothetical protein